MKYSLLTFAALTAGVAVTASPVTTGNDLPQVNIMKMTAPQRQAVETTRLSKSASMMINRSASGLSLKKLNLLQSNNRINPASRMPKAAEASEGASLWASFEGETLEADGWSTLSKIEIDEPMHWKSVGSGELAFMSITPPDGDKVAYLNYADDKYDEWLVSPKFTPGEGEQLSFWAYFNPFFFNSTDNIDWDTFEYIGEPVQTGDLEIWVKADGEWTKLKGLMELYKGMSAMDLMSVNDANYSVSLEDYAGKEIQVAFRCEATDCNSVGIDAVKVAQPDMEGVTAMQPLEMLYWGIDRSEGWAHLDTDLGMLPVLAPVTWYNYSEYVEGAKYSWSYEDPETGEAVTVEDSDEGLTLVYQPDFSTEATARNNFHTAPRLTGSVNGCSDATFERGYTKLQAGGAPNVTAKNQAGTPIDMTFSLMSYPPVTDGLGVMTLDVDAISAMAVPVFGHDANTDLYWLDYTLNGEEPSEGDYVKLNGYLNLFYAPKAPLVVTGTHALALGKISDKAKFRCDIYALGEDFVIDDANIIATTYCESKDVRVKEGSANDYLNIIFDFEKPLILDDSNTAYCVKISGFNSDEVSYFVPVQSTKSDPSGLCLGWVEKFISISEMGDGERQSFSPMAYVEDEEGNTVSGAFAICLDGYYPYMVCDTEEIEVKGGTPVEISLGSYYDGSELTVTCPEGITATASGRYDKCMLTVTAQGSTEGDIVISAPGVEKKIAVKATVGLNDLRGDSANGGAATIYRLDGTRMDAADVPAGVYIVRRADGSVAKAVVR